MIGRQRLTIDLITVYVEEHLDVTICYKCCRYGHVLKNCLKEVVCGKCGGKHGERECDKSMNMVNCINSEREEARGDRSGMSHASKKSKNAEEDGQISSWL